MNIFKEFLIDLFDFKFWDCREREKEKERERKMCFFILDDIFIGLFVI